ncbi:MAG: DUF4440 domain-containing protein [Pyrinomonadaceae bacterium]|nr:DUF4440 domain-containing protein [Pyrinomonadaceae bacterium]
MKKLILILNFIVFTFSISAQTPDLVLEKGVKPHKEIDAIYTAFTKGYRELNVDLVANLYTEDANYLASGSQMTDGRGKIYDNFKDFFDYVKKGGNTMEIKFRILSREVDKNLGYDVGIYTLNSFKDGKQVQTGQGKFFVVTKKIGNKWYFRYDSYSNLKPENQ